MNLKRKLLAALLVCMCVLCAAAVACADSTLDPQIDLGAVSFVAEGTTDGPVEYTGKEIKPTVKPLNAELEEGTDYIVTYSNNINVGTATITINPGPSKTCMGSNEVYFQISPKPLNAEWFSLPIKTKTYNGTAQNIYIYSTNVTTEDFTYRGTVRATDQGTYTVKITGVGNYSGTVSFDWEIEPLDITNAVVNLEGLQHSPYTGSEQKPRVSSVTVGSVTVPASDYTVEYNGDTTNASSDGVEVVVSPKTSNITGTASAKYYIDRKEINGATVLTSPLEFNWEEQTPDITVVMNGTTLVFEQDYTIEISQELVTAGRKSGSIKGQGNYIGSAGFDFDIEEKNIKDCTVELSIDETEFNWAEQKPKVTVTDGTHTLVEGTDYEVTYPADMTSAGEKTVTVTGKGNFTGTADKKYTITKKGLVNCTVELSIDETEFNWAEQKPVVTVTDNANGKTLADGVDYEVTYPGDMTGAGERTVTVTGKGNFTGTVDKTYTITQIVLTECTVELSIEKTVYNWAEQKPVVTVTDDANGKKLSDGVDYEVTYPADMTSAGEKTVKVTGTGNFTYTVEKTYSITQKDISQCTLTLDPVDFTYNGKDQKPSVSVKDGSYELLEGTDYMVSFPNDVAHIGTKTVTVSGMTNFCGSNSADYTIQPKAITITADDKSKLCGVADPTLTATVTGLEDGFAPVYTLKRATGEVVGSYSITVEGDAAQGDYVITYKPATMFISYAPAPATAPVLDYGTCQNGWYGVKPVRISYPGYTIAKDSEWSVDESGAHGFQSDISYGDGYVHAVYRLCDASGAVTDYLTLDYAQDTTLPSFTLKDENVHVALSATDLPGNGLANGAQVSGAIIRVMFNDRLFDEITAADETGTLVPGATLEKSWVFYQPGTVSIIVEDYAGNSKEVFRRGYADSDRDGLNNPFEQNYFKSSPDNSDTDGDGLDDLKEYRLGTDPNAIDSDGDGLTDGEEVTYGFDPRKKDTDDDGVDDLRALLLGTFLGVKDVPAALNLRMDYRQNAVPGAMTNEELAAALDTLTQPGRSYLEPLNVEPYQLKGGKILSRGEETINLQKQTNLQYVKSNNDTSMLYGVYGDSDLMVAYDVKNTAMKPAMGWNLAEIFGSSFDCYSVVASDDAQVIAIAPWDEANDCALADIAVIMPDSGKVWIIKDSKDAKRFDVAPDGTKIAYMNNGEANLLDMVTCNPLDAYKAEADMLAFTADGGMVVSMEGNQATVCTVVNDELTRGTVTYVGMYDKKQPTQNSLFCGVVLDQETAELYSVEPHFDVYVNGVASSPATLNVLTYRNEGEKYATQYRNFFNQ